MSRTYGKALALVGLIASVGGAQATARLAVTPDSKVWIEGTSNPGREGQKVPSYRALMMYAKNEQEVRDR